MATRAASKKSTADWRAGLQRSIRRTTQMAGAGALLLALFFLALALASYTHTDPSLSTAASGEVIGNWMGRAGAWASDFVYMIFGLPGLLLVPLLYVSARRLWRGIEIEDEEGGAYERTRWWGPLALLLIAMALLSTVLAIVLPSPGSVLPAQLGGLTGLLSAGAIEALSARLAGEAAGWISLGVAALSMAIAVVLLTKIFAIDWRALLTLPDFLVGEAKPDRDITTSPRRGRGLIAGLRSIMSFVPVFGSSAKALPAPEADLDERATDFAEPKTARAPVEDTAPRRAPEISDPSAPPRRARPAKANQKDMFATFDLPSLDLLAEPPEETAPALDKLALERNARLLENVLADINDNGEITAVRTGPEVAMYE